MEGFKQDVLLQDELNNTLDLSHLLDGAPAAILGENKVNRLKRLVSAAPAAACMELFDAALCHLREKIFAAGFERAKKKATRENLPQIEKQTDLEFYPARGLINLAHAVGILSITQREDLRRCQESVEGLRQHEGDLISGIKEWYFICRVCVGVFYSQYPVSADESIKEKRGVSDFLQDRRFLYGFGEPESDPYLSNDGSEQKGEVSKNIDFESLLDAMQEAIAYYDEELNIVWCNRASAELSRSSREKMIGKNFYTAACKQKEPCDGCPVIKGISSDFAEVIESNPYVGRLFYTRSLPVFSHGRKLPGRLLVSQDVSRLRNRYGVRDILNTVSEVFYSSKNLKEICLEVVKMIARTFNFPICYVALFDEKSGGMIHLVEYDCSGEVFLSRERFSLFEFFSKKVVLGRKTLNETGLSHHTDFREYALKGGDVETVLAVPLNVEMNTIGAVVLLDYMDRPESSLMVDGLQAVANRLGAEINRKQTLEKLKEERNFTMAVLNSAGPLIIVLNREGQIFRFNKACEKITGCTVKEAVGKPVWEFLADPKERNSIKRWFPFTGEKPFRASFENWWTAGKGENRLISWSNSVMGDPEEKTVHIVCIGVDITDKRRAEEEAELRRQQLLEADKMASLGFLASEVAHEINNPNNFIMMNVPILRNLWESATPILEEYYRKLGEFTLANIPFSEIREEVPELFDGIEDGAQRIRQIVLNMKDYARKDVLDMSQEVDLNEVVQAALGLLSPCIKKYTSSASIFKAKRIPRVRGDRQRLEQVVVNLLQNACQSLPDRGKGIAVSVIHDEDRGENILCVSDEGTGIRQEHMDRIFDPFFTTKSEKGGTGLGLPVCLGIVKEHHGRLEFDSESGKGTKAYLLLPAIR